MRRPRCAAPPSRCQRADAELSAPKLNQAENQSLLWNYLPSSSPEFRGVSEAGGCHPVEFETDSRVDDIQLEHVTGEGRFGEVRMRARARGEMNSGPLRQFVDPKETDPKKLWPRRSGWA